MSNSTLGSEPLSPKDELLINILRTFTQPDQDLVGLGAMIGFLVAGGFTQIFSLFIHRLKDCKSHTLGPHASVTKTHVTYRIAKFLAPLAVDDPFEFWINIISALLIGLSDQQLVMGLLVLAIICGTKGASFSMLMASYISYFTLITHAAAMVTMRPYFRKFRWMTLIRVLFMLAAFSLWIVVNSTVFQVLNMLAQSTLPALVSERNYILDMKHQFAVIFGIEVAFMGWIYLSMIPSLFIPGELVKVRKAVARWPLLKEKLDESVISDWVFKQDIESHTGRNHDSIWKSFGETVLWPHKQFCRLFLQTKSNLGRTVLWFIAEIVFPWSAIPVVLLLLFIALLVVLCTVAGSWASDTEWNFGQILPLAMVALPFWALVQGYAEDKAAAIEDKKALQVTKEYLNDGSDASFDKSQNLGNDIIVEPIDIDAVGLGYRPRSAYFARK